MLRVSLLLYGENFRGGELEFVLLTGHASLGYVTHRRELRQSGLSTSRSETFDLRPYDSHQLECKRSHVRTSTCRNERFHERLHTCRGLATSTYTSTIECLCQL